VRENGKKVFTITERETSTVLEVFQFKATTTINLLAVSLKHFL